MAGAAATLPAQTYGPTAESPEAVALAGVAPPAIPPELARAAVQAIGFNPAMRAARIGNRAAETDVKSARWLYGPSVSVNAFAFEGGSPIVRDDRFTANLVVYHVAACA